MVQVWQGGRVEVVVGGFASGHLNLLRSPMMPGTAACGVAAKQQQWQQSALAAACITAAAPSASSAGTHLFMVQLHATMLQSHSTQVGDEPEVVMDQLRGAGAGAT